MGACTFTQYGDPVGLGGSTRLLRGNLAFSSSYATNGDTIDWPGDLNIPDGGVQLSSSAGGYVFEYDGANQKVKAFRQKDPAAAGGADIALPEVANAVNLSAVSVECWVLSVT